MRSSIAAIRIGLVLALLTVREASWGAARWPDEHVEGSFIYHADFGLSPYLELLRSITALEQDVPATLGLDAAPAPIHVFLFLKKASYQRYMQRHFPSVPARRALFIKERGPGMVFAFTGDDLAVDLRHETTHAVLHSSLPLVPLWLDEGLAEYFEVAAEHRGFGHPHLGSVRWNARWGRIADLNKLEQIGDLRRMHSEHYRDAWAWVHFMLHGPPEARLELQRFLQDLQSRTPPGRLSERLRRRLPNLDAQFLQHFQQWKR
jgi:hypothetical protein